MISPKVFAKINSLDISAYYNIPDAQDIECELCTTDRGILSKYHMKDDITWYYCNKCNFSGTTIDYLQALKRKTAYSVINHLHRHKWINDIETKDVTDLTAFYGWRTNLLAELFSVATSENNTGKFDYESSELFRRIPNIIHHPDSLFFATTSKQQIESWLHPNKPRGRNTSSARLFVGTEWDKITCIPLYDFPYHTSSLLFLNNTGGLRAIKRISPRAGYSYTFDVGYLASREILHSYHSSVILSNNIEYVLKLQAESYKQLNMKSPVIGWFVDDLANKVRYAHTWAYLIDTPKIFWCTHSDTASIREACNTQSHISHFSIEHVQNMLNLNCSFKQITANIIKAAIPWHQAITGLFEKNLDKIPALMDSLELTEDTISTYLEYAPELIRKRINKLQSGPIGTTRYLQGGLIVTSNDDGWWITNRNKKSNTYLGTNIRCYIDKVINIPKSDSIYQGRLVSKSKATNFAAPSRDFETNPSKYIRDIWMNSNPREFPQINIQNETFKRIINAYSDLSIVNIPNGIGWDYDKNLLRLPNLLLSGGDLFHGKSKINTLPFCTLKYSLYEDITEMDHNIAAIYQRELASLLPIVSAVVTSILAPAFNAKAPQTLIVKGGEKPVQNLFDTLRLPELSSTKIKDIETYSSIHQCPFLIDYSHDKKSNNINPLLPENSNTCRYAFITTSLLRAIGRMSYGGANLLLLPQESFYGWSAKGLRRLTCKVLLKTLVHISKSTVSLSVSSEDWNSELVYETYRYYTDELRIISPELLRIPQRFINGYVRDGGYIIDFINLLLISDKMDRQDYSYIDDTFQISLSALRNQYRACIGYFDLDAILEALRALGLLIEHRASEDRLILHKEQIKLSETRLEHAYGPFIRI